jgi:ATP-dependent DNA helicase RecG
MIILNAERFGLSQIHQLRGRVGRSNQQSYCYLVSNNEYCPRLKVLEASSNGFDIAAEDFNLRGPGDYLGDAQSGHVALDYADFQMDFKIWKCAYDDSKHYVKRFMKRELFSPRWDRIVKDFENQRNKIN